ncbi:hypothetical protein EVJ58_g2690 [Rhodofomes roseus]|uniref:F-box domain-containing protein n=1 Tax=Rhodofomes roseus TaxID=34475 RepID=A0A4Y9YS03_9APHY|nr:hypothetical protein EVJ58_g2690 [Rhodofomes roseus]
MDAASGRHASPALPAPQTRQAIEAEIARYSNYLIDLRTRLNTFASISVLPPEVLSEVFMHTAGAGGRSTAQSDRWGIYMESLTRPYSWIRVSHVCRHWRAVALNCPALWGNLTVTKQREWMEEVLGRSKKAPLYVSVDISMSLPMGLSATFYPRVNSPQEDSLASILSHTARIRSLSLGSKGPLSERILRLLDGPAPLLETLTMRFETGSHICNNEQDHIHKLLHPETSRLRQLHLHSVLLQWNNTSLPQLTHLTVTCKPHQVTVQVHVEAFLRAIEQMSVLEELVVQSALTAPIDQGEVPTNLVQASLPRLRYLRVLENTRNTISLLSHMTTPSLARLFVEIDGDTKTLSGELFAALATKTPSLGTFATLVVTIARFTLHGIHIQAFRKGCVNRETRPDSQPELEVCFGRLEPDTVITNACESLPICDVHFLTVSGRSLLRSTLLALFKRTKKVVELNVTQCADYDVLPGVLVDRRRGHKHRHSEGNAYHYILPHLRSLSLSLCYFGARGDPYEYELEPSERLADGLIDSYIQRYEYGAEIEQLHIVHPVNLSRREVDRLKEVVRVVEWDGTIDFDEQESDSLYHSEDGYDDGLYDDDVWGYEYGGMDMFDDMDYDLHHFF